MPGAWVGEPPSVALGSLGLEFGRVSWEGGAEASGCSGDVVGGSLWNHEFVAGYVVAQLQSAIKSAGLLGARGVGGA